MSHRPSLARAVLNGDEDLARRLLGEGADPDQGDLDLDVELMVQQGRRRTDLLAAHGVEVDRADPGFAAFARTSPAEMRQNLLDAGGALPPVVYAAVSLRVPLLELLIRHGCHVDVVMPGGEPLITCLTRAACWQVSSQREQTELRLQVLRLLARVQPVVAPGRHPPVMMAVCLGHEQVTRVLLEAGADPTATLDGWTPLEQARADGREDLVALLEPAIERWRHRHDASAGEATT